MNRTVKISASPLCADGVRVDVDEYPLELSLDCHTCQRRRRTVIFSTSGARKTYPLGKGGTYVLDNHGLFARCTPTGHAFPGRIVALQLAPAPAWEIVIAVEYEFQDFVDLKYGSWSTDQSSWARVHFGLFCPRCGRHVRASTQTNLVRPWTAHCNCHQALYTDEQAPAIHCERIPPGTANS